MESNVVITGVGIVSSYGIGKAAFTSGLMAGKPATSRCTFAEEGMASSPTVCGAFLDRASLQPSLPKRGVRTFNWESQVYLLAALLACADARIEPASWQPERVGIVTGTVFSGYRDYAALYLDASSRAEGRSLNPAQGPQTGFNAPCAQAAIYLNAEGPNLTVSKGVVSTLEALAEGVRQIEEDRADTILAGGVDVVSLYSIEALFASDEITYARDAARPFDAARTGVVFGEGAAVFALESTRHARHRGALPLAYVSDCTDDFEPGAGERAAQRALETARDHAGRGKIDTIYASASGEVSLDGDEARALHRVFGEAMPVCAVKGALGEGFGVSGGWQTAAALEHLRTGLVPPTAGYRHPDPTLPPLRITTEPAARAATSVLVHAMDGAGSAATLLLGQV